MNSVSRVLAATLVASLALVASGCAAISPPPTMADTRTRAHELVDGLIAQIPEDQILSVTVTADRPFHMIDGFNPDATPERARWMYYVDVALRQDGQYDDELTFRETAFKPYVEGLIGAGQGWKAEPDSEYVASYLLPRYGPDWVFSSSGLSSGEYPIDGETFVSIQVFAEPAVWDQSLWDDSIKISQTWPSNGMPEGATQIENPHSTPQPEPQG
ncbi:hypothetical protein [Agromyces sp. Root81]|uniref:hypothetical protein n=1 Tax=Agromyces sp. Root81 TaxID=1736601 RepID=UPI000B32373F|nr:hypothetical protein [Agromyces sp. Root81]